MDEGKKVVATIMGLSPVVPSGTSQEPGTKLRLHRYVPQHK